jgi:hypothetical protein
LNPESEIRDPGWVKIRIRDKHPGSATLVAEVFKKFLKMFFEAKIKSHKEVA